MCGTLDGGAIGVLDPYLETVDQGTTTPALLQLHPLAGTGMGNACVFCSSVGLVGVCANFMGGRDGMRGEEGEGVVTGCPAPGPQHPVLPHAFVGQGSPRYPCNCAVRSLAWRL